VTGWTRGGARGRATGKAAEMHVQTEAKENMKWSGKNP